jgi:transposase
MIIAYPGCPEDYARGGAEQGMARPNACPNCRKCSGLRALGYYSRWVSSLNKQRTTQIRVRRFRCPECHRTTSMLPDFAQTYRLVETDTVDRYFSGSRSGEAVDVWMELLGGYQKRFENRLPETRQLLSDSFGLGVLSRSAVELWEEICRFFGGARRLTARLANEVGMTVFGLYLCHHPFRLAPVHTSALFTTERSPPFSLSGHDSDPESEARH